MTHKQSHYPFFLPSFTARRLMMVDGRIKSRLITDAPLLYYNSTV